MSAVPLDPRKLKLPLTKVAAAELVMRYLATIEPVEPDNPWEIVEENTEEHEWGWVYCWHNRTYIQTGDPYYLVGGNSPVIVDKLNGALYSTGTAMPTDHYIEAFLKNTGLLRRIELS
jgi:hypothetical protein